MSDTPLRRQYLNIKSQYPDTIVFFRLGDFYETFDDDAAIVARVCDVVLTARPTSKDQRIPMAGVPYHRRRLYFAPRAGGLQGGCRRAAKHAQCG